jgi:F-type H+-transporting ATPase subunit b
MRFDWSTLALQTINVLVLLWLLRRFLFRPVAGLIAARQQAAETLLADAAAVRAQAAAGAAEVAGRQAGLAADAARILAEARAAGEAARADLLAAARQEAARDRAAAAAGLARERGELRRTLEAEARSLAVAIAARLLGRFSAEAADAALRQSLAARLSAMTPPERAALAPEGAALEVVTASPLDAARQGAWQELLLRHLPGAPVLRFAADPALIAGVELRGAHATLRNHWRADLDRIAEELSRDDAELALA